MAGSGVGHQAHQLSFAVQFTNFDCPKAGCHRLDLVSSALLLVPSAFRSKDNPWGPSTHENDAKRFVSQGMLLDPTADGRTSKADAARSSSKGSALTHTCLGDSFYLDSFGPLV